MIMVIEANLKILKYCIKDKMHSHLEILEVFTVHKNSVVDDNRENYVIEQKI